MEDLYSIHPGIPQTQEFAVVELPRDLLFYSGDAAAAGLHTNIHKNGRVPCELSGPSSTSAPGSDLPDLIKAKIASHPRYPALLSAYIDCRKVGAPPEMASLLEEIRRGEYPSAGCSKIGADPELDEFMAAYYLALVRYKEELSRPFDEAASFLSSMEMQLSDLCKAAGASPSTSTTTAHPVATSAVCNSPPGKLLATRSRTT